MLAAIETREQQTRSRAVAVGLSRGVLVMAVLGVLATVALQTDPASRCLASRGGTLRRGMPHQRSRFALLALAAMLAASCAEERLKEPTRLASSDAWSRVADPAKDVFASVRPEDASCDDDGYYVEPLSLAFEVNTGLCDYLTVSQLTPVALFAGDRVELIGSHDTLVASAPSQGYMGFAIDGEILWEFSVPIPRDPEIFTEEVVLTRDFPAGAEMQLHVHNHGDNTWELQSVRCLPADAEE